MEIINSIEKKLDWLLKDICNSDLKLLNRWAKILTTLHSKECKSKGVNIEILNKIYLVILDIGKNILCQMDQEDEESIIYMGPNIFESLIKIKNSIIDHEKYLSSLKEQSQAQPKLQLTESQIESLNRIKCLI